MAGREALVAALRARGVDWLAPTDARLEEPLDDETLIGSLAAHADPRLRQALTGLFLLQPQLWEAARRAREQLAGAARDELTARYMAAALDRRR